MYLKKVKKTNRKILISIVAVVAIAAIAVGAFATQYLSTQAQTTTLNGAGASFPFPLIDKWAAEYHRINSNIQVNYQSIGSGGGIRQHTEKTVQFAASDAPLTDEQFTAAPNSLHIPMTIGGVAITYNVPSIPTGLKFSGNVVAEIFLGNITKWNDQKIAELNPSVDLPNQDIIVVHRSDGSGTTYIFTNYLSDISHQWETNVGKSTSVNWPLGIGGKGNEGVAGVVSQNPYSIGYVEFIYAKQNNLPWGLVENSAGEFVEPSLGSFSKAASFAAVTLPTGDQSWSAVSIVDSLVNNTQATGTYPITSFSYFLVYKELNVIPNMDRTTAQSLTDFLWWTIHDGQNFSADLVYVPLPQDVRTHNEATIRMITFDGEQVYKG
jgi:phosphate transport system substrate-binding protein